MRAIRTALSSLTILALGGTCLHAQDTGRVDVAAAYVAQHANRANTSQSFTLQGGSVEAGVAVRNGFGIAGAFTGVHAGSIGRAGVPLSLIAVTAGPRYRVTRGKLSPYGEALFGYAHGFDSTFPSSTTVASSANSAAVQINAGLDIALKRHMQVRALEIGWLHTALPNGTNDAQNDLSVGAGVVLRLGR